MGVLVPGVARQVVAYSTVQYRHSTDTAQDMQQVAMVLAHVC